MSRYAILGATGNTGQCLLQVLLQTTADAGINAFCRSKQKLLKLSPPGLEDEERVHIFEGDIQDVDLLADCLRGTRAVFVVVAGAGNQPGCTLVCDTVHSIVAASRRMKSQNEPLPKVIFLSSASLDHALMPHAPKVLLKILWTALLFRYEDIQRAEEVLESERALLTTVFVRPGVLWHRAQRGHWISTKEAKGPLSYVDLAAGMLQLADEEAYDGKAVAVNPLNRGGGFPLTALVSIFKGLVNYFLPWTYPYFH